jgi:hypothetical protein
MIFLLNLSYQKNIFLVNLHNIKIYSVMKVLVDVPSNEVYSFIELINTKNYQIIEDSDIIISEEQIEILEERKNTPKSQFISREQFSLNLRNRHEKI